MLFDAFEGCRILLEGVGGCRRLLDAFVCCPMMTNAVDAVGYCWMPAVE